MKITDEQYLEQRRLRTEYIPVSIDSEEFEGNILTTLALLQELIVEYIVEGGYEEIYLSARNAACYECDTPDKFALEGKKWETKDQTELRLKKEKQEKLREKQRKDFQESEEYKQAIRDLEKASRLLQGTFIDTARKIDGYRIVH